MNSCDKQASKTLAQQGLSVMDDPFSGSYGAVSIYARRPAMSPLGKLIESRRSELNLSYEDIAKRGGFPKATVYALSTKKVHRTVPRMTTLASLAKGLSLPLDVVRQAAALSAGYATPTIDLQEQEDTAAIFAAVNEMTDSQRATLRQIATAMIR